MWRFFISKIFRIFVLLKVACFCKSYLGLIIFRDSELVTLMFEFLFLNSHVESARTIVEPLPWRYKG
jgi:hypothetical protein